MRKKITKIILLGVVIIMGLGVFAGCDSGGNNGIQFDIGSRENTNFITFEFAEITQLVRSSEDLQQLYERHGLLLDDATYDESFFSSKAVIVHLFIEPSVSVTNQIDKVDIQEEELIITVLRLVPRSGNFLDAEENEIFLIVVSQDDVENINTISVVQREQTK